MWIKEDCAEMTLGQPEKKRERERGRGGNVAQVGIQNLHLPGSRYFFFFFCIHIYIL